VACWSQLKSVATEAVESTLTELPGPLRQRAKALPVTLERRPNSAQRRDGVEADTLGLFVGPEFADETAVPLPAQIILFWRIFGNWLKETWNCFGKKFIPHFFMN